MVDRRSGGGIRAIQVVRRSVAVYGMWELRNIVAAVLSSSIAFYVMVWVRLNLAVSTIGLHY